MKQESNIELDEDGYVKYTEDLGCLSMQSKQEPVAYEGLICWYGEKPNGALIYAESKHEKYILEDKGFEMKPLYTAPKELSDEEMNEIIQFLNQSRISWSGNEFIKEAMRLAIKKASEKWTTLNF